MLDNLVNMVGTFMHELKPWIHMKKIHSILMLPHQAKSLLAGP